MVLPHIEVQMASTLQALATVHSAASAELCTELVATQAVSLVVMFSVSDHARRTVDGGR